MQEEYGKREKECYSKTKFGHINEADSSRLTKFEHSRRFTRQCDFVYPFHHSIQLIPGYRGFVVDNLRLLQVLDDVRISADEKHLFKGLAKRRGNFHSVIYSVSINIQAFILVIL